MRVGILGSGLMGGKLGTLFARAGHDVVWFERLRDRRAAARIQARIDRAESGNLGDCKPVGEGVSEMRIDHGPGYRLYFLQRGTEVVLLLVGGGKATQAKDIELAKQLAKQV